MSFITITELNKTIKECIDNSIVLKNITIRGELQGFKKHPSGHYFFKMIDESASINCIIYSFVDYENYAVHFKDGDLVEAVGSVTFFNKRGDISFSINKMKAVGDGEKLLKKKLLLEKLLANGYLDESKKKQIPIFPSKIGIITSKTGAAVVDVIKNVKLRTNRVQIYVFNCLVQGADAPNSIIEAIQKADSYNLDTLIIGRGGGSKDDLSAFDEESVALSVYKCKTPIISAVGHEIDKSVCDFVADLSVSTPTAAAISAVPDDKEILDYLEIKLDGLNSLVKRKIDILKKELNEKEKRVSKNYLLNILENNKKVLVEKENILKNYYLSTIKLLKDNISNKCSILEALNPNNILSKGYSIIYDKNKNVLSKVEQIKAEKEIIIKVSDGEISIKGE